MCVALVKCECVCVFSKVFVWECVDFLKCGYVNVWIL